MKAYEIQDGFGLDNLRVAERPIPVPGPHQVLVRLRAASLNYRDLMTVEGAYNPRQPLPLIPCSDGAGEVASVGGEVEGYSEGDRVMGAFAQEWFCAEATPAALHSTLGGPLDGTLAQYVLLGDSGTVRIPEPLTFEEAACLPCAGVTAWNALMEGKPVRPGDTVLLLGTGGVSLFALKFATMAGARVIITSSSDEKLERAGKLGAWEGINYRKNPDWDKKVLALTGKRGVDRVVEVGGAETMVRSLKTLCPGGVVALIGVLSGVSLNVPATLILMKGITIRGIFVGSRAIFKSMNRAVALHQLKPVVDRVFPFDEAPEAFRLMKKGSHFGKIVIRIE